MSASATLSPPALLWDVGRDDNLPPGLDVDLARRLLLASLGGEADAPSWHPDAAGWGFGVREGRAFILEVSAGTVALRAVDEARAERRRDNPDDVPVRWGVEAAVIRAGLLGDEFHAARLRLLSDRQRFSDREHQPGYVPRRVRSIREWTARSRARLVRCVAELDFRPMASEGGVSAMVTLTYPGDWLAVVPSRAALGRHLEMLRSRWGRAFLGGRRPCGLWKLEFQRRGAPHIHAFMRVHALGPDADCRKPGHRDRFGRLRVGLCRCTTFERWLSRTWADIVAAEACGLRTHGPQCCEYGAHLSAGTGVDFSMRATDPKRLAVYFLGHGVKRRGGKEYQHRPPADWLCDTATGEITDAHGTGRFWGAWGLPRCRVAVYVDARTWYALRRQVRRMMRATGYRVRRGQLGRGGGNGGGWMLANDGLSSALAAADRARQLLVAVV